MAVRVLTTDDFDIEDEVIGEGAYSVVKRGRLKPSVAVHDGEVDDESDPLKEQRDMVFAIKQLSKAHIVKEKKTHTVKREKIALVLLRESPHIVRLYHTFQDPQYLYFAMEYCPNGDLQGAVEKFGALDIECARFYLAELALALRDLRRQGIVHRDLKPENLLLDESFHLKLADFGSSVQLEGPPLQARSGSFVGTAEYVAPELLNIKTTGLPADIWGFGCCLYYLVCGRAAFSAGSEWLVFEKIQHFSILIPQNMDAKAKSLLKRLVVMDESSRLCSDDIEMKELFEHPFFEGVDFDAILDAKPPELKSSDVKLSFPTEDEPTPAKEAEAAQEQREKLMAEQQSSVWSQYLIPGTEVITYQGLLSKKASLIPRKRMFLLTDLPRLVYIDPVTMTQKGEVPLDGEVHVELKTNEHFFIHVPGRTYVLMSPDFKANEWKHAIELAVDNLRRRKSQRGSR